MLSVTIRHVKYISELLQIISYYPDLHWDNEFQMDILDICFSPIKNEYTDRSLSATKVRKRTRFWHERILKILAGDKKFNSYFGSFQ